MNCEICRRDPAKIFMTVFQPGTGIAKAFVCEGCFESVQVQIGDDGKVESVSQQEFNEIVETAKPK